MSELIDKLKNSAIERCRQRIIEARQKPNGASTTTQQYRENYGFTSKLKKMRGGLS